MYKRQGDTVKELFRVNVSNDNGLVNVTTSVKSVSYTHLDVYKRQAVMAAEPIPASFENTPLALSLIHIWTIKFIMV